MGHAAFAALLLLVLVSAGAENLDARLELTRLHLEELESRQASSQEILQGIREHLQAARDYYNELAAREVVLAMDIQRIDQRWFLTDSSRAVLEDGVADYILFIYSRRNMLGPTVLFAPGGLSSYLRRTAMIDHLAGLAVERLGFLEQSGDSLARYRDSLETLASSIRELRLNMEVVQERIYREEERQTIFRSSLENQIVAARDSAEALEQRRRQLSSFVSTLETGVSSGVSPSYALSSNAFISMNRGSLSWPVRGSVIRAFGSHTDPVYGTESISDGVSIAVSVPGAGISAIAPGVILYAREFLNMGRMVVIDHQDGYYSVYAHLGSLDVSRGQAVGAGTPLGSSGPLPGGRNGCYLEIRRAGVPIDPLEYLERP